jgi:hypothetical protein
MTALSANLNNDNLWGGGQDGTISVVFGISKAVNILQMVDIVDTG